MSKVLELRELEANIKALQARMGDLSPQVEDRMALINLVIDECKAKGFDRKEIALAIFPDLATKAVAAKKLPRKSRKVKAYLNPNTGETIETKGGNHKGLKLWKEQYGANIVESWLIDTYFCQVCGGDNGSRR